MRDRVCLSVEQLAEAVEKAEPALSLEKLSALVLDESRKWKTLSSFAKNVRKRICVDEVLVFYRVCE